MEEVLRRTCFRLLLSSRGDVRPFPLYGGTFVLACSVSTQLCKLFSQGHGVGGWVGELELVNSPATHRSAFLKTPEVLLGSSGAKLRFGYGSWIGRFEQFR